MTLPPPLLAALLAELHDLELDLAGELRRTGERHAAERDVLHVTATLASHGRARALTLEPFLEQAGDPVGTPDDRGLLARVAAGARRATAQLTAHSDATGPVFLDDLRRLAGLTHETAITWTMAEQAARASRNPELLHHAEAASDQLRTQAGWLTTRIKEAAPQILTVPTSQ